MTKEKNDLLPSYPTLRDVRLEDGFLGTFAENIRRITVQDVLDKFVQDGCIENYDRVARGEKGGHGGYPWTHGLICECIRGISDLLMQKYDEKLDMQLDDIISRMAAAQNADPEGFLNPYTTLVCPEQRWGKNGGNIIFLHETYNAGCMAEAGVHHYLATGKTNMLSIAVRMGNFLADFVGEPPKHNVVCEHPLPEEAFLKLYELFRDRPSLAEQLGAQPEEYRRIALYFIDHKGDNETRYTEPRFQREYSQDHCPVRRQREGVGHAVRAMLFYTGCTLAAAETGDRELQTAMEAIWADVTETKFHANGSVGTDHGKEALGTQYELPNNAYLETCAGVGFAFWGWQYFRLHPEGGVFDLIETTLRNVLPASVSQDFVRYNYENPLESDGTFQRREWYPCPCCPPMVLKLVGMLPRFLFATRGKTMWVNLYENARVTIPSGEILLKDNTLSFTPEKDAMELELRLRIPGWSRGFAVTADGKPVSFETLDGYAVLSGTFTEKSEITVSYDTPVLRYEAHPYVHSLADIGAVMVKKGPTLYCAEGIDNGGETDFVLSAQPNLHEGENDTIVGERADGTPFTLIPYYRWCNRGQTPMRVWLRQEGLHQDPCDLKGWEHLLYRPYK